MQESTEKRSQKMQQRRPDKRMQNPIKGSGDTRPHKRVHHNETIKEVIWKENDKEILA